MQVLQLQDQTTIQVLSPQGDVLLEEEIIELSILLSRAQRDLDTEALTYSTDWLDAFRSSLEEKYGCQLSKSHAWVLATRVSQAMLDLKKSSETSATSLPTTSSTLTESP